MKATKGNKVYTIDETQKNDYAAQGYDITNDDGEVIKYGAGKTVAYEEYKELEVKFTELQKENEEALKRIAELEKENDELKKSKGKGKGGEAGE